MKAFRVLICALLLHSAATPAVAQGTFTHALGEYNWTGLTFFTDQDMFDPWRNSDRNYTMGVGIAASGAWVSKTPFGWLNRKLLWFMQPPLDKALLTRHALTLLGAGFTPDSLTAVDPVIGDRPYGSIFALSSSRVVVPIRKRSDDAPGESEYYPLAYRTEVVIGALGTGVADGVQTWIHEHNSSPEPLGWDNQISEHGEPTLLLRAQLERRLTTCRKGAGCGQPPLYEPRYFEATTFGEGMLGYYTNASAGLKMRLGYFRTEFWEFDGAPLSTISQAGGKRPNAAPNKLEAFVFAGATGRAVAHNALLQGQFKSNVYEIPSSDVQRLLGEFQIGAVASIPLRNVWRVGFGYLYAGRSREFSGTYARSHTWGSAFLSISKIPIL